MVRYYRKKGFVVAAEDESTFGLIPNVARGWAVKASKPTVTMNYSHKYVNVFAARSSRGFVYMFRVRKTQKDFIELLKKLLKKWGRVLLFLDNVKTHHGKLVQEFQKKHRKTLKLAFFPKYTPELNPVEPCWKPGKIALSNRLIKTIDSAKYHLRKTYDQKENLPKMFKYLQN
jgi:transposase